MNHLLNVTATIQSRSAASTDAHGNPVSATASSTSVRCYFEQTRRDEQEGARNAAEAEYLLVLPAGTSIDQNDRVVIGSTTYEVKGQPWQASRANTGQVHHLEATIVEVSG